MICGWDLIKNEAKRSKVKIFPLDSEHFSIMNLLNSINKNEIDKIYLTASGGPFLNYSLDKIKNVKPEQAINHPKWKMGKKISVDSATLMNKIFEIIEAQKLFNIPNEKLDKLLCAFIKNGIEQKKRSFLIIICNHFQNFVRHFTF